MRGVNKIILIGHLGKDPEVRHLESGVAYARFTLATTETYFNKNTNEKTDETQWHNVVLWGGLTDVAEKYLKKGSPVYIEGKMTYRSYEQDGITKNFSEVRGWNMIMLGGRSGSGSGSYGVPPPPSEPAYGDGNPSSQTGNIDSNARKSDSQSAASESENTSSNPDDDLPF